MSSLVLSCKVEGNVGSDHYPVKTILALKPTPQSEKTRLNFSKWVGRLNEELISCDQSCQCIDSKLECIEKFFKDTRKECTYEVKKAQRRLPPEIISWIKRRKLLLNKRKFAATQAERMILSKEYNAVNNKVRQLIYDFDQLQLQNLAQSICETKDVAKMWRLYNKFKSNSSEVEATCSPLILENGDVTLTSKEKCDEFGRHLQSVHQTPNNPLFDMDFKKEIDEHFEMNPDQEYAENVIGNIDVKRMRELLSQTKKNSAAGEDVITYDVMRLLSDAGLQVLCTGGET